MTESYIYSVVGPVVVARGDYPFAMQEMVYVGNRKLIGEVIKIDVDGTTIQVYEETTSLKINEPVYGAGSPMYVLLGPGLLGNIFDGIERPLKTLESISGAFIATGIDTEKLDAEKKWETEILVKEGDFLESGAVFAKTAETPRLMHKSMVPPNICGTVVKALDSGAYGILEPIVEIKDLSGNIIPLSLAQKWPIRTPRPVSEKLPLSIPLITGQRVIDSLFPVAKGGTVAIPGGFGTGKTMTQHQLAKWSDADIIVYIGCGERGNEMTQVLEEFGELIDERTKTPLTDRTILIANTSNMPVAAREASIYTGVTLAEYYRDMGYNVAIMADSTSRWAEALREISGRLEEMPAEEGFPAYLPSRISEFYERAGRAKTLCGEKGSVTIIGAVSPQGSDFSEPVTQNTKRFTRCFWGLDKALAYQRHYPAINWISSYSEYADDLEEWFNQNTAEDFSEVRDEILSILHEEEKLMEIAKLIGTEMLPDEQKLIMETAKAIRIGFLQQNAYNAVDTYVNIDKQYRMMKSALNLKNCAKKLVERRIPLSQLIETGIFADYNKLKYEIKNNELDKFDEFDKKADAAAEQIISNN